MIHEILSPGQCAACRGCCIFEPHEQWEAPEIALPLKSPTADSRGCRVCRHLTEHGCALGQGKPPDCSMYPFRVMTLGEIRVIAVSRFCKPVADLPLTRLAEFADAKSAEFLAVAEQFPEIVKEYNHEYVILKILGVKS